MKSVFREEIMSYLLILRLPPGKISAGPLEVGTVAHFSLNDISLLRTENLEMVGVVAACLGLPLPTWNHHFMDQGKVDWGSSILSYIWPTLFHDWGLGRRREPSPLNHTDLEFSLSNRMTHADVLPLLGKSPPIGSWWKREPCVLGCTSLEWSFYLSELK